jgi:DNA-binding SARP family transcriptional activator
MDFRILGPLEVSDGGRPVPVTPLKQRALLAALLLRPGQVVSIDRLLDDLWGEAPPPSAKASLQNAVSRLRRHVGPELLVTRPPGYVLDVAPERIDVRRFERLLEEARNAPPRERAALLREALALWRGPPLADVAFEPFAAAEIDRLGELRAAAREELVEAELALGRHEAMRPELDALVAEHPFRERPRAQLMLALYRSGRQAEALDAYQAARRFLDEELGLEPSPLLQQLQQAILRQDPALDVPAGDEVAEAPPEERRSTVTVVFADLLDSTELAAELDPEVYRDLLRRYYRAARSALERHGATVERFVGDAVVGVFGVPRRQEDDALRAVRAAAELVNQVGLLTVEVGRSQRVAVPVRAAVNTGEAVVGGVREGQSFATGYAVNVAAKLRHTAMPGEVLLGAATYRLVRDAVQADALPALEAGGTVAAIPVFRLVGVVPGAAGVARRLEAPLVGRGDELAALRSVLRETRKRGGCRVVTVLGEAGIGKTRLANELVDAVRGEATVLVGRCVSYGEGATYLPLAEVVRALAPDGSEAAIAGLLGDDRDAHLVARRVRELTGLAKGAAPAQEAFWAVRRLLEAVARERPVLLVLEDVHWAEPTLLDLVEHLGAQAAAPILVLCLARPELLEGRPDWVVTLALPPLSESESAELVGNLPGAVDIPQATRDWIAEVAEGNALFAEQLLAHVGESGEIELPTVPPSLEALIASRLDRLAEGERAALECAAVVGREFWEDAVSELGGRDASAPLEALVAKGLVRPSRSLVAAEQAFSFHHVLIRDVAYAGITKRRRSELHERAAEWLEAKGAGADEIVGHHLEQAYRYRVELAPADRHARQLAEDAGERLGAAGVRAWRIGDAPAATNLLGRATELLPTGHASRPEALRELGSALWAVGEVEQAQTTLGAAINAAVEARDRGLELRGRIDLAYLCLFSEPEGRAQELLDLAAQAIPILEALGDHRSLGRTWLALAFVHGGLHARYTASESAAERALVHYRRLGWVPAPCVRELATAVYYGPTAVGDAIARCRALLEEVDEAGKATLWTYLAGLEAMRQRFAAARRICEQARLAQENLGWTVSMEATWSPIAADVELLGGDYKRAERILRDCCDRLQRLGQRSPLASRAAQLAGTFYTRGNLTEAERWSEVAEESASSDDAGAHLAWRGVRAKVLARRGRSSEAEVLARAAVRSAESTDALNDRAGVLLDLAEVLRLDGRDAEASALVEEAMEHYERKGNRAAVRKARSLLRDSAPA